MKVWKNKIEFRKYFKKTLWFGSLCGNMFIKTFLQAYKTIQYLWRVFKGEKKVAGAAKEGILKWIYWTNINSMDEYYHIYFVYKLSVRANICRIKIQQDIGNLVMYTKPDMKRKCQQLYLRFDVIRTRYLLC